MEYGLQLYSIRDITGNDLEGALKQVADLGYKFVEFAGFFGHSAEEVKGWLDKYGLEVSGTHTGLKELENDLEGTIAYHKAIGNKNIIIPGHDLSDQAKIDDFVEKVNKIQPVLKENGIALGYHNHSHEFIANKDGSQIEDQLIYRTNMDIEIDTFWFFNATGESAVSMMERIKDRLKVIHIKDGFKGGKGVPLGTGEAPVRAVYDKAIEMGIPMVVESESLTPDGMTEARICIEYLKAQEN
ncbi:MAG: sugar phosphate isomerase/epimerase [Clostridia bacterium]|nr:sugar phosphate isomerase/epimerase [Clostridia bacterium]